MNLFAKKKGIFTSETKYKLTAPWKRNTNFEALPDQNASSYLDTNAENDPKQIKARLNRAQSINLIATIFGYISLFAGFFILNDATESDPLIHFGDSELSVFILIGVLIVAGFVALHISKIFTNKRNAICKQEIVRSRLQKCFQITDYVYDSFNYPDMYDYIQSLHILESSWNRLLFSDYFCGTYKNTPFIFFDCNLRYKDLTLFQGQIILIKLPKLAPSRERQARLCIEIPGSKQEASKVEDLPETPFLPEELLDGTEKLSEFINAGNKAIKNMKGSNRAEDRQSGSDASSHLNNDGILQMNDRSPIFHAIQQITDCDTGFVLSNNFLTIILSNNYDPFEFNSKELFKSHDQFISQIDAQVSWIWSIFKEVEKTGWL